jgi:hypothetical protein
VITGIFGACALAEKKMISDSIKEIFAGDSSTMRVTVAGGFNRSGSSCHDKKWNKKFGNF